VTDGDKHSSFYGNDLITSVKSFIAQASRISWSQEALTEGEGSLQITSILKGGFIKNKNIVLLRKAAGLSYLVEGGQPYSGRYYKSDTVIIYDCKDSTIVIYDLNDSGHYCKTIIQPNLALTRSINYDNIRKELSSKINQIFYWGLFCTAPAHYNYLLLK
jgi:hypothetical protein